MRGRGHVHPDPHQPSSTSRKRTASISVFGSIGCSKKRSWATRHSSTDSKPSPSSRRVRTVRRPRGPDYSREVGDLDGDPLVVVSEQRIALARLVLRLVRLGQPRGQCRRRAPPRMTSLRRSSVPARIPELERQQVAQATASASRGSRSGPGVRFHVVLVPERERAAPTAGARSPPRRRRAPFDQPLDRLRVEEA